MATATGVPVYYELSWSILSTIGLINVVLGLLVAGITSFSPISAVPIVVSAACAIANGLCYYAFYADYSQTPTLIAAAFADILWLVQEAGLSFYSYQILARILSSRSRKAFMLLFWFFIVLITAIRTTILVNRQILTKSPTPALQLRIDRLHMGYFISIALVESVSAFFLLRVFADAQASSAVMTRDGKGNEGSGLFRTLIRSTETRLATLALVGITRAVTISFQEQAQSAQGVSGQVDRFAYTLECMFPLVMMIDIMASKLQISIHNESSGRSRMNNGTHNGPNRIRVTTTTTVSHPNDDDEEMGKNGNVAVGVNLNGRRHSNGFIRMDTLERKNNNWDNGQGRVVPSVVREESL